MCILDLLTLGLRIPNGRPYPVVDPGMGGPGGTSPASPIDQDLGLVAVAQSSLPQTRGEGVSFHLNP